MHIEDQDFQGKTKFCYDRLQIYPAAPYIYHLFLCADLAVNFGAQAEQHQTVCRVNGR